MPKTPPDRSREVAVDTALCTIGAAGVLEPGFPAPRVFRQDLKRENMWSTEDVWWLKADFLDTLGLFPSHRLVTLGLLQAPFDQALQLFNCTVTEGESLLTIKGKHPKAANIFVLKNLKHI